MKKILLSVALALAVSAPVYASGVNVDAFIKRDKFGEIRISPTGEYLATTVPLEDRTIVTVIRRSDSRLMGKFVPTDNAHVGGIVWVSPTRLVMSMAEKDGSLEKPSPTGELYAMNADGSGQDVLIGYRADSGQKSRRAQSVLVFAVVLDTLPQDDDDILVAVYPAGADNFPRVERLNVNDGRRRPVVTSPVRNARFLTDSQGAVRFAWGANTDRASKLYHRPAEGGDWVLINDEAATGRDEAPIGFSDDGRFAYLQSEQEKGPDQIVSLELATGKRSAVFTHAFADPSMLVYRNNSRVPVVVGFDEGRSTFHYIDPAAPESRAYRALDAAFPDSSVYVSSSTADGKLALVQVYSDRNPGDVYLFDTVSKKVDYLLSRADWIDPEAMHPQTAFEFKARDGMPIRGLVTRPRGSSGRLPMVVLPHGGPFGIRDAWGFDSEVQMLASAGYAVLQVNFRGSGGYGRAFKEAGRRQWGLTMQDDLTDATKWAVEQGIADGSKICLYGASYGAYASLMGVAKEPSLYRCAAGYVGVYDLPTMFTDGDTRETASGKGFLLDWIGVRSEVAAQSPTRMADRITVPVFMAAGGEDKRTPIAHTQIMERALIKAGRPVETLYYPTEGHGFYKPEHEREFYTRLLAFLGRHLGGATASAASPASAK